MLCLGAFAACELWDFLRATWLETSIGLTYIRDISSLFHTAETSWAKYTRILGGLGGSLPQRICSILF